MKLRIPPLAIAMFACLAASEVGGCAAGGALSQGYAPSERAETAAIASTSSGDYKLTPEEAELDCKKLAGKVQLRILEFRSGLKPEEASSLARNIQSVSTVFGSSEKGLNANAERAREVAKLQAYNKELADKNCRSFDIAKALTSDETVPSPTVPPKSATR